MGNTLQFANRPEAKASFAPGLVYAVDGGDDWIYFGQLTPTLDFAFFRFRSVSVVDQKMALTCAVMSRFTVDRPSVGAALRRGVWLKLDRAPLRPELLAPSSRVQWPVGSSHVTVWSMANKNGSPAYEAMIDDPTIQDFEILASWDATHHVPGRLRADFGAEVGDWHVGGPVWRQRRVIAMMARRHPSDVHTLIAGAALIKPNH